VRTHFPPGQKPKHLEKAKVEVEGSGKRVEQLKKEKVVESDEIIS